MKQALATALEQRGYNSLTPVQEAVTADELIGADLLVSAQTGSGKTLGFGLAIAPGLMGEAEVLPQASAPLALIIAPTRELAMQVKRELAWLYAQAGAVVTSCVGGMDMRDERRALARGAHIVVATPGRLRDHIMRGSIELGELLAIVLDEADEMLDLGFREDLEFILGEAPETRQTLLFSATVPAAIAKLAKNYQKDAVRVSTTAEKSQHADIEYCAMNVSPRDGENAIINVLRYYEAPNAIVFCNTRAMVNRLTTRLSNRGFSVVALSGELSQNERTHALQAMRDGRARVCVATDVAARGIDLPNLDLVVHAELPSNHETLLHRSGRTGRAGRKGVSALIVPPAARKKAQRILGAAKLSVGWEPAPSAEAVSAKDEERMLADPAWAEPITEAEQGSVATLVERFSHDQIAAAYLRLHAERHSAPEELASPSEKPAPRAAFGPSVWFAVAGGRAQGAEPRRLLPMICKAGGLTKDDIGAIRIAPEESFIEIKKSSEKAFLEAVGPAMKVEDGADLRRADGPPSGYDSSPRSSTKGPRPPRDAKPYDRKPDRKARDSKPQATKGTTKTVDWNDDPKPRQRKPKPGAKGDGPTRESHKGKPKPAGKPEQDARKPKPTAKPRQESGKAKAFTKKPKRPTDPSSGRKEGGAFRAKGPKPPAGKPSSKKNRARAANAGKAPPTRGRN